MNYLILKRGKIKHKLEEGLPFKNHFNFTPFTQNVKESPSSRKEGEENRFSSSPIQVTTKDGKEVHLFDFAVAREFETIFKKTTSLIPLISEAHPDCRDLIVALFQRQRQLLPFPLSSDRQLLGNKVH